MATSQLYHLLAPCPTRSGARGPAGPQANSLCCFRTPYRKVCQVQAAAGSGAEASRRSLLVAGGALTASQLIGTPSRASGMDEGSKKKLFDAIAADKGVEDVMRELESQNPTPRPAKSDLVYGRWKLLWASDNSEVANATKRLPLPSESIQLIGEKGGVEKGRVANIINIVNGGVVLELSSSGVPDDKSDDTILIGPPFNLKINLGGWRLPIQNTEAGGERKSLLGNDVNYYRQLYLDNSGKPGDLRLSEVTTGDKYAQGSMYVHQRL
ncbi:hypothetical protein WJX74_004557 [Apatococcus lobatus]|uniref:Plastid lipid-associated protein/fibrillin conserved domain-containing protein n=2 Tax=Apatococcus TaxID=904362 RepID=A0AAW1TA70_9CHLO